MILLFISSMTPVSLMPGMPATGSGVLINTGFVLSAAHGVAGWETVSVKCGVNDTPAAVIATDMDADLALLELSQPCDLPVTPISTRNALIGSAVRAVGCPKSKCGWQAFGRVMAYDTIPGPTNKPRPMLIS